MNMEIPALLVEHLKNAGPTFNPEFSTSIYFFEAPHQVVALRISRCECIFLISNADFSLRMHISHCKQIIRNEKSAFAMIIAASKILLAIFLPND
jgi:hypothetical protein